jgi:hypothetical protein
LIFILKLGLGDAQFCSGIGFYLLLDRMILHFNLIKSIVALLNTIEVLFEDDFVSFHNVFLPFDLFLIKRLRVNIIERSALKDIRLQNLW